MKKPTCAPQKVDPALIARFRPAKVGCFWPIFFFADHNRFLHNLSVCKMTGLYR